MKTISRHIRSKVLLSILVVTSIITIVDLIYSISAEFGAVNETYSLINALTFILFNTPTRLYELLPFAVLGGAFIGLGLLASNNELIVIQATGVKVRRIVWLVLKPCLVVMLLNLLIGEYIAPVLEQTGQTNKAIQRSGEGAIVSPQGTWHKVGSEYIHINAIASSGEQLYGVTRYQIDSNRKLSEVSFARSAEYQSRGLASYWILTDVQETVFSPNSTSANQYSQLDWHVELTPELLNILTIITDRNSITALYRFANYAESEGLDPTNYLLAFWKKLLQPISTLSLVVLAISFIFGPLREASTGYRIGVAMGIGLSFSIVQRIIEPVSILIGFTPFLAVITPILAAAVFGLFLLRTVR